MVRGVLLYAFFFTPLYLTIETRIGLLFIV
nr:MAG TPA: hypothetical protein [Caudoviricetes sp.]